jgi:hypothetical protein
MAEACTPGPLAVEPLPSSGQLGSPGANGRGCAAAKEDSGWRMEDGKTAWRGTWSHAPGGSGTESWRQILRERCFPIRYEGRQYATLGADTGRLRRSQSRGPKVEGRRLGKHLEITWRAEGGEPEGTARGKPAESHPEAKAECRMQNAEQAGKAAQSHPQATHKPPTSHQQATNKPPTSHQQATNKPLASHLQARCMGGASVLPSYSLRIPFVFSSYSLGILLLFSGGAFRGAMAAPPSPCLSSTRLVCPLFKRNRIFLSGNSSRQP